MAQVPRISVSSFGFARRALLTAVKYTLPGALVLVALGSGSPAFAGTATKTTLALTSGGSAVTLVPAKTAVTLTATVVAGATQLTVGQVNFCDAAALSCTDVHLLGTQQLTSAGTAVLNFYPPAGNHSYKAVFLGTNSYLRSASGVSALQVTALQVQTTTTIAASGIPGNYTLTATVTGTGTKTPPAGTVSFQDTTEGNAVLGSAPLGKGAWQVNVMYPYSRVLGNPWTMAVGDVDGDGLPDLLVADQSYSSACIDIFLSNGGGGETCAPLGEASLIVVGDFNGDGIMDLAVPAGDGSGFPANGVDVLLGNGDGTFTAGPASEPLIYNPNPPAMAVGDFNGDGIADVAIANNDGSVTIFLGNGDGSFTATPTSPAAGNAPAGIAVGDFNGDGKADLAVTNSGDSTVSILLGNGDGTFTPTPVSPPTGGGPSFIEMGDFNGDGKADLAILSGGTITILLGNGDGTFYTPPNQTAPPVAGFAGEPLAMAMGDFNGDGVPDLFVLENPGRHVFLLVLLGNGDGTFSATATDPFSGVELGGAFYPTTMVAGGFNGDGTESFAVDSLDAQLFGPYSPFNQSLWVYSTQPVATSTATVSNVTAPPGGSGTHQVLASYPGNTQFNSSASGTVALTAPGQASLSAVNLSFGIQELGTTTASQQVTLTNTFTVPLSIASIAVTGPNASSFAFANNCGSSLPAGASCSIHGHFTPVAYGPLAAAVTIADNATGSPQSIALSGTGYNSTVSLSSTSLSFGAWEVGLASQSQQVTFTNTGAAPLSIAAITVTGANAPSFIFANNCGSTLAAGASCSIHGHFTPAAVGAQSALVTLTDSAIDSPQSFALSGTGKVLPEPMLSANNLSFGMQQVGATSQGQMVTFTNTSGTTLPYLSIQVTGANPSSFIFGNTCQTGTVAPGATCTIHGHFTPASIGDLTAEIVITDGNSPLQIWLTGTGGYPPAVSLSTGLVLFGNQAVGTTSAPQQVLLTNSGGAPIFIASLGIAGTSAFQLTNNCGATVAAGASCTIAVKFAPVTGGGQTATIVIADNAPDSPQSITLNGIGGASATLSATVIAFGSQKVGTTSASQSVTLTNTGGIALSIESLSITGPNAPSFVFADSCGTSLAIGASCTIHGHFSPTATGPLTATLALTDNAYGSPQTITLSGTGD